MSGEGTDRTATCPELVAAREKKQPIVLYVGRGHFAPKDKAAKKENKAARKFEKRVLNAKKAAEAAEGFALLRFDLFDEDHALLARQWGVESAPTLLIWAPEDEKPVAHPKLTGNTLAGKLKRLK